MKFLTTIYPIKSEARLAEIRYCIEKNAALECVDQIVVLAERASECDYEFLHAPKIEVVPIDRRPTYADFFALAAERFPGEQVAVCNSDVYFDETLEPALAHLKERQLWCLCRRNADGELQGNGEQGSADAWLFVSPLPPLQADILIGVLGCDTYLAQKAVEAKIETLNPCLSVRLVHVHRDPERNDNPGMTYWQKPDYRCLCLPPCRIGDPIPRPTQVFRETYPIYAAQQAQIVSIDGVILKDPVVDTRPLPPSRSTIKHDIENPKVAVSTEVPAIPEECLPSEPVTVTTGSPRFMYPPPPSSRRF